MKIETQQRWSYFVAVAINALVIAMNVVSITLDYRVGKFDSAAIQVLGMLVGGVGLWLVISRDQKYREELKMLQARREMTEKMAEVMKEKGAQFAMESGFDIGGEVH